MAMNTFIPWVVTLILLTAILILLWQRHLNRLKSSQQGLAEVLATSRLLFNLAIHLQQHRGMSSAWLSGDASFLARLKEKQALINTLLPDLQRDARREGSNHSPCFTSNDFSLLVFRWRSLVETLADKQPEQSIAEHSHLIALLLNWLAALGEARIEPLVGGAQLGLVCNYAHRLPTLAECLGQARAIGSSVAARHACSPVARVRLMFLIGRAEALLEQATQANDGGRITLQARAAIRDLTHTVRTNMLLSDGVAVSPDNYFAVATRAIDSVVAWIEQNGAHLQSLAQQPAPGNLRAVAMAGGPG
jgi:hypothetical protein